MRKYTLFTLSVALILSLINVTAPIRAQASVELKPCSLEIGLGDVKQKIDADCGVLPVPEDRSKPDGRQLDIHFTILRATNPASKAEPIFHLEGGPGGSAISNFTAWYTSYRSLFPDHDVVLIDQRGTGTSASLQCTEIVDTSLADLKANRTPADDVKIGGERLSACLTRLSKVTDPAFYNSLTMADDTDAVREALGYDKINVFGNSYGTWLAQIYLRRHEEHVNAVVLDSVVGPWNNFLLDIASNSEASLTRIFDLCQADTVCNEKYPQLRDKFVKALDTLEKKPATTTGTGLKGDSHPVVMTRARLLEAFRQMFYNSSYIGTVPQAVTNAANGNYSLAATILVSSAEQSKDFSVGLYYSVICAESVPFYTDALIKQYDPTKYFGAEKSSVEDARQTCANWRSAELDEADVAPVKSDKPVLILSGAFDPVTPIAYGEETKARFPNSTLATFPYQAHGLLPGSKCAQNLTRAFLLDPTKPLDTSCTANDVRPVFAGTFEITLKPFSNPDVPIQLNVPEGWTYQPDKSTDTVTFFASKDNVHLLGAGVIKAKSLDEAQQIVSEAIKNAYGIVDAQFTLDFLGSRVVQQGLDNPDQVYTAALTMVGTGGNYRILWYAAPNNVFVSSFESVVPILLSIR
ncbi:MAG: alpha/beta fold hydrolase [Anaerolineae bacterium]|nr:alpha/beta fold hydrolase [Anaerolineae bacterium]